MIGKKDDWARLSASEKTYFSREGYRSWKGKEAEEKDMIREQDDGTAGSSRNSTQYKKSWRREAFNFAFLMLGMGIMFGFYQNYQGMGISIAGAVFLVFLVVITL